MKDEIALHWFRQDLRLSDNPSLNHLTENYTKILCIFIFDQINCNRKLGSASKNWLYHSLNYLNKQLNGKLLLFKGDPGKILSSFIDEYNIKELCWNRCYEPWRVDRDKKIKEELKLKINVKTFNSSLLWEPWEVLKDDGTPYKIFTPFYKRGCLNGSEPRKPMSKKINFFNHQIKSLDVEDLNLLSNHAWEKRTINHWKVGEEFAGNLMNSFFSIGIQDYSEGRNFPIKKNVSRLSPYLHWGQISPHMLWHKTKEMANKFDKVNLEIFQSELGWREFFYNLMFHFPKIQDENLQKKFDKFPWSKNSRFLSSWQKGKTGFPIIDAGMRELWQTGYMHNRVRMITGSFLVKNLLIHWKHGEKWFWDCLFDADYASNSASWQWVAGTGTDAAPYFRIFNPITQAQRFDPNGAYIKKFLPELKVIPIKYLFSPWEMPKNLSESINFVLGKDYPKPIVDLKFSRELALDAFAKLKILSS